MEVLQNPFWLIGANEFTQRDEISNLVEQRSLFLDENVLNEARLVLLTPRRRFEAEVGWIFALPVGDKPYVPTTLEPQLKSQLQEQQELIAQFLQAAQNWKEAHVSSALTSQHADGVSLKAQLAQAVQFNPQASNDVAWFTVQSATTTQPVTTTAKAATTTAKSAITAQPAIFPLNVSFTWQELQRQESDSLSIKVRTLGHQVLQHLSQVANGCGALSTLNVLSLLLECTEFYPGNLRPTHGSVGPFKALPEAADSAEVGKEGREGREGRTGPTLEGGYRGLGDYLWLMIEALSQLNVPKIMTVINLARKQAKVPLVSDVMALEDTIAERKHQIFHVVTSKLACLTQSEQAAYLTNLLILIQRQDSQLARNSELLRELFELYELQSHELFLRHFSWETQILPMFGSLPEKVHRLEVPFETLRLAWWLDEATWRIDLAVQDVFNTSRLWMQRQRPIILWYVLQERDVTKINALATLAKLWRALLKVLSNPLRTFYRGDDVARYCWDLFKGCGVYEQQFQDTLRRLAVSDGPWDNGKLRSGRLLEQMTVWIRPLKANAQGQSYARGRSDDQSFGAQSVGGQADEIQAKSDANTQGANGDGADDLSQRWQCCEISLFESMLQIGAKQIPLSEVEVMRYASSENLEIVELYSAQGQLLAEIGCKDPQMFIKQVKALAQQLNNVKFTVKFFLSSRLGRDLHFGRLHVRWGKELVIYSEQDLDTELVYKDSSCSFFSQDGYLLNYKRRKLKESEDRWILNDYRSLESTLATFQEFDNLPILVNYLLDSSIKRMIASGLKSEELRSVLMGQVPQHFGIL